MEKRYEGIKGHSYWCGATLFRSMARAFFSYRVINRDRIPERGGFLLVANHESFLDPPLIGIACPYDIHYLARKTLFKGPFNWLYQSWQAIPVDQDNPDMASLKKVIALVQSGEPVLLFPEGARTEDGQLQPGQPGVGLIVSKSKVPVIPVRIKGAREALPRGSSRMRCHPIEVVFGKPIEFTTEELKGRGREGYQRVADRVMEEISRL